VIPWPHPEYRKRCLSCAVQEEDVRRATIVLAVVLAASGIAVSATDGTTPAGESLPSPPAVGLHMAVLQGDVAAVEQHVAAASDLDARDAFGSTPLLVAATFGRAEAASALLRGGADTELRNNDGATPLHVAAFLGFADVLEALLDAGADPRSRDALGATAYDIVSAPLESDAVIYAQIAGALAPFGFVPDYEAVSSSRPAMAGMLKPEAEELESVGFAPEDRDDWEVSTPEEEGLDPLKVAELYLDASEMERLYAVLVVKDGRLVAEGYFNEGSIERRNLMQSATKSYVSALVGIAIEQGCLSDVDQKLIEFFPELADRIDDPRKRDITVRHLLQMRAGFPWEESDPVLWDILLSGDYIERIADLELISDPGAAFNYSNLSTHFLGVIVARACDSDLRDFAREHLLSPIGVEVGDWRQDVDGYRIGGGEIHTTARDAARFGQLYLDGGEFHGTQAIPAEWVEESLTSYSSDIRGVTHARVTEKGRYFRDRGYGYQWWSAEVGGHHVDYAAGHGGQYICLVEDQDMVVVAISDPFYLVHNAESWKYELGSLNLIGKFIASLPAE